MGKKILITWWGALENGGETAGDLLAVMAICNELDKLNILYDVSSRFDYKELKNLVNWRDVDPFNYDKLLFICGPVIYENSSFCQLLEDFQHCTKIALGVSGLTNVSHNPLLSFDKVLSRDGFKEQVENIDLSLNQLSYETDNFLINKTPKDKPTLGLCLRGMQREYGRENCFSEHVNYLVEKIVKDFDFTVKYIDTKLNLIQQDPFEVLKQFGECDFVITTRLHGSLFSLAKAVPFIAVDQIKEGAKVNRQLSLIQWPFTFLAQSLDETLLANLVQKLISKDFESKQLEHCRSLAFSKASDSLDKSMQLITEHDWKSNAL